MMRRRIARPGVELRSNGAGPLRGRPSMDTRFGTEVDPDSINGKAGESVDGAMSRYQTFHDKAPMRVVDLGHDLPTGWVCVGECLAVMYRTDKWHADGDDEDYKHLHDETDEKPYAVGRGVKLYEPKSEWARSTVDGRRRASRPPKTERLPVVIPEALTLLGYCLGFFVRLHPEHAELSDGEYQTAVDLMESAMSGDDAATEALNEMSIYESNPRGCWLFCSPSGDMLAVYSPESQPDGSSGFLCAMAGGKLRVLKDGIDG
jgi:hypothetical protein